MVSKQFDYYNSEIVNCSWNQPKEAFNNILIDLNDPNFFLEKVNLFFATQRKERKEVFSKYETVQKKIKLDESARGLLSLTSGENTLHPNEHDHLLMMPTDPDHPFD